MKFSLRALSLVSCAAFLAAAAGTASAGTISGTIYYGVYGPSATNPQGQGYATAGVSLSELSAAIATTSGSTTFTSTGVDFDAPYGTSTEANFLNYNGNASGVSVTGGIDPSTKLATGNLIVLTGDVALVNGQSYTILHDDGINLYVDGFDFDAQQAQTIADQSPITWTGATGTYEFELIYVSNYEAPSVLEALPPAPGITTFGAPTPEPSSFVLLGSGLLAAAGVVRRRMMV